MLNILKSRHLPSLKRSFIVVSGLLLTLLLLLQLLPFLAIGIAKYQYSQQGEGYELSIQDWQWSPLATKLNLTDVVLAHPQHNHPNQKTAIASLSIHLDPWLLIKGKLEIADISIAGLQLGLVVQQTQNSVKSHVSMIGLSIPLQTHPKQSDSETIKAAVLPIRIHNALLTDSILNWQHDSPDPKTSSLGSLHIANLQFESFSNQSATPVMLKSEVSVSSFSLGQASRSVLQQPLKIHVKGKISNINTQPTWQGDLNFSDFSITLGNPNDTQVSFKNLKLQNLKTTNTTKVMPDIDLKALSLSEFELTKKDAPLLSLKQIKVDDIFFQPNSIRSGNVYYDELNIQVHRLKTGILQGFEQGLEDKPVLIPKSETHSEVTPVTTTKEPDTPIFSVNIAGIKQLGNSSGITIIDSSVLPAYSGYLRINQLDIAPIHIQSNAHSNKTALHIQLALDDYNLVQLNGDVHLKADNKGSLHPEGDIQLNIQQLDAVAFNGYLAKAIGYHLEKGMLQLSAAMNIHDNKLNGTSKILLRNSRFVPEDEGMIASVSKKISMPVDMALDLLRDDNGNIELEVPIGGDLSNPNFGSGDIGAKISALVLQNAAMHYLKLSLQPYSLFLSLGAYAGSELMAIRLDAIKYAHNQFELTQQHTIQLQNIADIMTEKLTLELQVCPFVNKIEADELSNEWKELASNRANRIKAWLAKKQDSTNQSLAPRITVCKPQKSESSEAILGF